jgi:hypothetical protein
MVKSIEREFGLSQSESWERMVGNEFEAGKEAEFCSKFIASSSNQKKAWYDDFAEIRNGCEIDRALVPAVPPFFFA